MNDHPHDPPKALSYEQLVTSLFGLFSNASSHDEVEAKIGPDKLTDISANPQFALLNAMHSLPDGHVQRAYQFKDVELGRGVLEVVFEQDAIVNVKAQLYLEGWLAKRKAKMYFREHLAPLCKGLLGQPTDGDADGCVFKPAGYVGVARHVTGTNSVSAWLMDDRYA